MADPVIRIVIEEGAPGQQPGGHPGPGAPQAAPPNKPVGGGGDDEGGADDHAGSVGRAMKAWLGRRLPGGQKTLDLLGLDKVFDDVAGKISPAIKKLSETVGGAVRGALGKVSAPNPKQGFAPDAVNTDFLGGGATTRTTPALEGAWNAPAAGGVAGLAGAVAGPLIALYALGEAGEAAARGIRGLGRIGAEIVANDPFAAVRRVTDGVIDTLDEIPVIGKAITAWPKVFMAVGDAAGQLKEAFLQNAKRLAEYSGPLSAAESLAEVRHVLADLNEAQRTGPKLAQVVTLQSEIDVQLQSAMTPLKEDLLEILIPILQATREILKLMPYAVTELESIGSISKQLLLQAVPGGAALDLLWQAAKEYLAKINADDAKDDFNDLAKAYMEIDTGLEGGLPFAEPPAGNGFGGAPG